MKFYYGLKIMHRLPPPPTPALLPQEAACRQKIEINTHTIETQTYFHGPQPPTLSSQTPVNMQLLN